MTLRSRRFLSRTPARFSKSEVHTPSTDEVGDLFMSLIHTAELCGVNSFDYLTELQRHARELAANPVAWMPWNYRETLKAAGV